MESLAKLLLAWFGNPIRALATAMIATSLVLLLRPFQWFATTFQDPLWRWPLIILVVSSAGLATYPLGALGEAVRKKIWRRQRHKKESELLKALTVGEKHVLQEFLDRESKTATFWTNTGDVKLLVTKGLIEPLTQDGAQGEDEFAISEHAWEFLQTHREVIETPGKPRPKRRGY